MAVTVRGEVIDINAATIALTGDHTKLVKYFSTARVAISADTTTGSIDNDLYIIKNNGKTVFGKEAFFYTVSSNVFTISAANSAGEVGTKTIKPTMVNYVKLTCQLANNKLDGDGSITILCSGNYFNGSFGAKSNTITVRCRYKEIGGTYSSWYTMSVTPSGNLYSATKYFSGLDYTKTYVFQCSAADELMSASTSEDSVSSKPVFHWGQNDFKFEVPVTAKTVNLDDYGYCYIEGDGSKAKVKGLNEIELNSLYTNVTGAFAVGGKLMPELECGTWTPRLSVSNAVISYEIQQGWYQKVGNVVTIGWAIKAKINTNYNSSSIYIVGTPYKPSYAAFGGGIINNVYITGGFNFLGWRIGDDGYINARLQQCNNTAAGDLQISSSVCYPKNGGDMNAAGTICYMV